MRAHLEATIVYPDMKKQPITWQWDLQSVTDGHLLHFMTSIREGLEANGYDVKVTTNVTTEVEL